MELSHLMTYCVAIAILTTMTISLVIGITISLLVAWMR